MYNCVCYFCIYLYGLCLNGWHAVLCITNNRHDVTITTHAIKRHFIIWMTTSRQPTKRRCSCVLTLKYTFIWVYWWTRQRIHNTLIAVNRYLRLMGDKTIPDSAEPRLESFYPPFVAGIDLPHQGVVDSYNLLQCRQDLCRHVASRANSSQTFDTFWSDCVGGVSNPMVSRMECVYVRFVYISS